MAKKMETAVVSWGYIGAMQNTMETIEVNWGYIRVLEKKTETTIAY